MTFEQLALLLGLPTHNRSAEMVVWRLERLDLLSREKAPNHHRKVEGDPELVDCARLTEKGLRLAMESLGRQTKENPRDLIKYYQHLLMGVDLYLAVVCSPGGDWMAARRRAQMFEWFSSNEGTRLEYERMREFHASKAKRSMVTPDVTIETDTRRYLVEIERSTKSLKVVFTKIDQYADLFSPLKTAAGKPAYKLKYADDKEPVVVFVFQSEERAEAARNYYTKRRVDQAFRLASFKCGSVATVAEMLRTDIFGERSSAVISAPPFATMSEAEASAVKRMFKQVILATERLQRLYDELAPNLAGSGAKDLQRPQLPDSFERVRSLVDRLKLSESDGPGSAAGA
ncbi:MAG: replication-relaxation family protein [Deltaproteobacteria bacterium]|nr:replication-relaxation family protein [Deltaproteobacteria bacterium]